jgi:hypothetical protein
MDKSTGIMKDFFTALQHCLNAIDLGIDLESCLALYPEYEGQLRQFFQKWNGSRDGLSGLSEKAFEQILFDQALDECIKAVGSGESPESCYEKYPAYARRMKPWLMAVSDLPRLRRDGRLQTEITFDDFFVPEVPFTQALEEYIQAYRHDRPNIILARYPYYADRLQFWADKIPEQSQLPITPEPILPKRPVLQLRGLFSARSLQVPVAILLAVLLFFLSGLRLARASAATVPGEPLYPLKLVVEQIHLNIVPDAQKEDLKEQFAEERRKEASALVQADIQQEVAFDGEVTLVSHNKLVVSDVVILLDELGTKEPIVSKGENVHVEGYTSQKGVKVKRLDVHSSNGVEKTFVVPPSPVASVIHSTATPLSVAQGSPTSIFGSLFSFAATPIPTGKSTSSDSGTASLASGPTSVPAAKPTTAPTQVSTSAPTSAPTVQPTTAPTQIPIPTSVPTSVPTAQPTIAPTSVPTAQPTTAPTQAPTAQPTAVPTDPPTPEPTIAPTDVPPPPQPTAEPTNPPIVEPTAAPTDNPLSEPTAEPTAISPSNPE